MIFILKAKELAEGRNEIFGAGLLARSGELKYDYKIDRFDF